MIDLTVSRLSKYYGAEPVLVDVSIELQRGEKVALVGDNGSGKSTLFRILAGQLDYDSGEVSFAKGLRVGLIQQIPKYPAGYTVEQVLDSGFAELAMLRQKLEKLEKRMEFDQTRETVEQYGKLSEEFERRGGYDTETAKNKIANGLGIDTMMRAKPFTMLSGGEKTRVNLACTMLENADLLLLDEPTNHLDVDALEWLEEYIKMYPGTILIVSHDRLFLDRTVTRLLELEDGTITPYAGNYSFYMKEKETRYLEQKKRYEAEQKKIAELSFAAERLHGWGMGNKRLQVRAFAIEKRIERMQKTEQPREKTRHLKSGFVAHAFHGDQVLQCRDLALAFEEREILRGIDLAVEPGDRIALIGKNGTGKTTLLNLLTGALTPDRGTIRFGPAVQYGLLPQVVSFPNESRNLVETMLYELKMTPESARNHLAAFDFRGEDVFSPVSTLSGGERSRLALCILMTKKINLLLLDEPTNHLDLASREWIEEAVEEFGETLLFVSHDRYFIQRFANRIWGLKDGKITDFRGGYEEYRRICNQEAERPREAQVKAPKPRPQNSKAAEKKRRELEREIEKGEVRLQELEAQIEAAAHDFNALQELYNEQEQENEALLALYAAWDELG